LELVLTTPTPAARDAIDDCFEDQRRKLVRTASSILKDRTEAEDLVQQTMLAVWERAQGEEIRNPGGYLARAVYWNAIKQRARQRARLSLEHVEELPTLSRPHDDRIDAIELELAISELPLTQQSVIRLRFYLGLSFREIGNNLSISTNTAASRTRYALARLRKRFGLTSQATEQEAHRE
jgi:RNA polymerase sigma-70 factor (ECF subfamily)